MPAKSPKFDAMSKALQKAGFKFVGSTICYAFMQASGMVDDHVDGCQRSKSGANHDPPRLHRCAGTETNQFVPFPTGLRGYQEHGIWRGDATKHEPTNFTAPVHVWRRETEKRGWTVIEGLSTFAARRAPRCARSTKASATRSWPASRRRCRSMPC